MTEKDILKYDNVPVKEAAKYIGAGEQFVRISLQKGTLPIGVATQISGDSYTYNISPGLLIAYKKGALLTEKLFSPFAERLERIFKEIFEGVGKNEND